MVGDNQIKTCRRKSDGHAVHADKLEASIFYQANRRIFQHSQGKIAQDDAVILVKAAQVGPPECRRPTPQFQNHVIRLDFSYFINKIKPGLLPCAEFFMDQDTGCQIAGVLILFGAQIFWIIAMVCLIGHLLPWFQSNYTFPYGQPVIIKQICITCSNSNNPFK